jgi:hypothetical protein
MESVKITTTLTVATVALLIFGSNLMVLNFATIFNGMPSAAAQICTPPPSGMVSWWPGDGDPRDIKDGNTGFLLPDTRFAPGQVNLGFSVAFQPAGFGQGFSAVQGPTGGFPLGDSQRTIIAWIKTDGVRDPAHGAGIMHYGTQEGTSPPKNFHLHLEPDGRAAVGNGWGFGVARGTTSVADNQFHFLAGTYEGPSSNMARIYVDGREQGSAQITTPATGNRDPFRIGSFMPSGGGFEHGHFHGIIDEVAIFSRALSASEIKAIYDAGITGMCKTPPPTANAGADQTVAEGDTVTLDGTGSLDSDGTIASYLWTQTAGPQVTLNDASSASPSFTAPAVGSAGETLIFELTVTDNEGATSATADTVSVTVNNVNQNPIANAGADQTVNEGDSVTLDGTASSDPDGSVQSYLWTQTSGSTTVELDDDTSSTPSFTAPAVGPTGDTLTFELTVTDNDGATGTDTVDINIGNVNQPPTANAGEDQTVDEGTSGVQLDGSGSTDSDGNIASYQWEQTGGPSVTLNDAGTATATFDAPEVTSNTDLTFTLTVTDNEQATDDDDIVVTVNDVAEPPPPEETTALELRGFYSPVDMNDVINVVRSGQSVPLKFEIFEVVRNSDGDIISETEVTTSDAIESFTQEQTDCDDIGSTNTDEIETTNSRGTIEPRYDTDAGQFIGNWRTPSGQAGNCYTVEVSTADDSIAAYFRLR